MLTMSREKLEATLRELDQARYNHERWYKELVRSLTCQLRPDERDLSDHAHKQCRFGQWYYSFNEEELLHNQTFKSIEFEHMQMHQLATKLLKTSMEHQVVSPVDYDDFSNTLERLRMNIQALEHEIEETLYNRDPLTGARNRASMLSDLHALQGMVDRDALTATLCILDIDHFKTVNDTYGHQVGDEVLRKVTEYIMEHLRGYDKVYRYGGEEFLISMPDTDMETAGTVIERMREGMARLVAYRTGSEALNVTGSFGIASLEANLTIEEAIDHADRAMYRSKKAGRNRVSFYDTPCG